MTKKEIIEEVQYLIDNGFFKVHDSLRALQFLEKLENDTPDKLISNLEQQNEVLHKTVSSEVKGPSEPTKSTLDMGGASKINRPIDEDNPF